MFFIKCGIVNGGLSFDVLILQSKKLATMHQFPNCSGVYLLLITYILGILC